MKTYRRAELQIMTQKANNTLTVPVKNYTNAVPNLTQCQPMIDWT
jgi:hypothetical protein